MRWSLVVIRCLLSLSVLAGWLSSGSAAEFPYTAYVNSADVYVRSGPGKNYYPTDKLQKGEKVEVYRHDPGGWLAIRPPRDSYSWVSARQLEPTKKGLARSKDNRVVCRVGSTFSDVRDVIQVRLEKGEVVELIEGDAPQGAWYKIAPPSGEFRWMYSKFVDHDLQSQGLANSQEPRLLEADQATGGKSAAWATAGEAVKLASASEPEMAAANAGAPTGAGKASAPLSDVELQKHLDDVELELSAMVAEEITVWSFERLREKAERALDGSQTAIDRGRARLLVAKIDRFDDIKRRHEKVKQLRTETDRLNRQLGDAAQPTEVGPRFDGMGRLAPVVSRKVGAPQFALIDADGAVLSFLTPAPGVNLRHYVDKQVGVNGLRGFMTDAQKQHISVQRVTLLDAKQR